MPGGRGRRGSAPRRAASAGASPTGTSAPTPSTRSLQAAGVGRHHRHARRPWPPARPGRAPPSGWGARRPRRPAASGRGRPAVRRSGPGQPVCLGPPPQPAEQVGRPRHPRPPTARAPVQPRTSRAALDEGLEVLLRGDPGDGQHQRRAGRRLDSVVPQQVCGQRCGARRRRAAPAQAARAPAATAPARAGRACAPWRSRLVDEVAAGAGDQGGATGDEPLDDASRRQPRGPPAARTALCWLTTTGVRVPDGGEDGDESGLVAVGVHDVGTPDEPAQPPQVAQRADARPAARPGHHSRASREAEPVGRELVGDDG